MDDKKRAGGFTEAARAHGPAKEVSRGTTDELQILQLIIAQSPVLRTAVLERLRAAKGRVAKRDAGGPQKLEEEKKKA